jgi:hypothetical protein
MNANHVPIDIAHVDNMNATSLLELRRQRHGDGFAIVFGASLEMLFDNTHNSDAPLWMALDTLLDASNPEAIALFVHTRVEPLQPPQDGRFRLLRRISGDVFGMFTRPGATSDFEIVLFQRNSVIRPDKSEL